MGGGSARNWLRSSGSRQSAGQTKIEVKQSEGEKNEKQMEQMDNKSGKYEAEYCKNSHEFSSRTKRSQVEEDLQRILNN